MPDYLDIIKRPMDFSTMKRRLEDGVYDANFAALEADFQQIITNCMTYNAQGSDIYKQAVHVRKIGRRILHKFRKRHKDIAGEQSTVPEFAAEDLTDLEGNGRVSVRPPVFIALPLRACFKSESIAGTRVCDGRDRQGAANGTALSKKELKRLRDAERYRRYRERQKALRAEQEALQNERYRRHRQPGLPSAPQLPLTSARCHSSLARSGQTRAPAAAARRAQAAAGGRQRSREQWACA